MHALRKPRRLWAPLLFAALPLLFLSPFSGIAAGPGQTKAVEYGIEGWNFAAAQIDQSVQGFLIWADPGTQAIGDDLTVLWLERAGGGKWKVWGWKGNDLATAADWVRSQKNNLTLFSQNPLSNEKIVNSEVSQGSAPDPMQVVYLQNSFLNAADACLEDLAVNAESQLFAASSSGPESYKQSQTAALCWPCSCTTTWGATTCGAWVFSFAVPATGGGLTCHYTRTCTTPWTKTGRYWYCWSCAGTGTSTTTQTGRTTVPPGDPCVPPPP